MSRSKRDNIDLSAPVQTQEELFALIHPTGDKGERVAEQDSFRISRRYLLQAHEVEKNVLEGMSETNGVIIKGLTEVVSELDLASLSYALGKVLHDQSHTSRNDKFNTGLYTPEQSKKGGGAGLIIIPLIDLCREAYGDKEPTSAQKKKMRATIKATDSIPVEILFPNGNRVESYLCKVLNEAFMESTKARYYHLIVNPIFVGDIKKNYGLFPSDASFRLTEAIRNRKGVKKTPQHIWLMEFLASQQDGKSISLDNLLSRLNLTEAYKVNRGRVEKQLESLFAVMRDIGLLRSDLPENPVISNLKNGKGIKYQFFKNPDWSKTSSSNLLDT